MTRSSHWRAQRTNERKEIYPSRFRCFSFHCLSSSPDTHAIIAEKQRKISNGCSPSARPSPSRLSIVHCPSGSTAATSWNESVRVVKKSRSLCSPDNNEIQQVYFSLEDGQCQIANRPRVFNVREDHRPDHLDHVHGHDLGLDHLSRPCPADLRRQRTTNHARAVERAFTHQFVRASASPSACRLRARCPTEGYPVRYSIEYCCLQCTVSELRGSRAAN